MFVNATLPLRFPPRPLAPPPDLLSGLPSRLWRTSQPASSSPSVRRWRAGVTCEGDVLGWRTGVTYWGDVLEWRARVTCESDVRGWRAGVTYWCGARVTCAGDVLRWRARVMYEADLWLTGAGDVQVCAIDLSVTCGWRTGASACSYRYNTLAVLVQWSNNC